MTVVLPAPFGPIRAWRAPCFTCSERSRVTFSPPKDFSRPFVSSAIVMTDHFQER
jgi:hypothetical protein